MSYKVVFNHPALQRHFDKFLRKLSLPAQEEIMRAVTDLAYNPRPHGVIKIRPPLDIYNSVAQYRLRVRHYRIFYDIDDPAKIVSIIALRKRNEKTYD